MRRAFDRVDAIVLAGGINRIALFEGYEPGYKALLPIRGRPAIAYTLDALRATPQIGRIAVVGPEAELRRVADEHGGPLEFTPPGDSLVGSIMAGLAHFRESPMVLVATADLPLLTAEAVGDFLSACACTETSYPHSFYISVVPKACFAGVWEGSQKEFNRFRDVAVSHGNLFLADPRVLDNREVIDRVNRVYNARKNPVGSAMAIGWRVGLSYVVGVHLLHALTLSRMAAIASWRFGLDIVPVAIEHPGVAEDVDEPTDYAYVVKRLEAMSAGH